MPHKCRRSFSGRYPGSPRDLIKGETDARDSFFLDPNWQGSETASARTPQNWGRGLRSGIGTGGAARGASRTKLPVATVMPMMDAWLSADSGRIHPWNKQSHFCTASYLEVSLQDPLAWVDLPHGVFARHPQGVIEKVDE